MVTIALSHSDCTTQTAHAIVTLHAPTPFPHVYPCATTSQHSCTRVSTLAITPTHPMHSLPMCTSTGVATLHPLTLTCVFMVPYCSTVADCLPKCAEVSHPLQTFTQPSRHLHAVFTPCSHNSMLRHQVCHPHECSLTTQRCPLPVATSSILLHTRRTYPLSAVTPCHTPIP